MRPKKRVAINGFGRIGRCVLRALLERQQEFDLQIVAINEPADLPTIEYLTRYDSTHGKLPFEVVTDGNQLIVDGQAIAVSHHQAIEELPWRALTIDLVLECSGVFSSRKDGEKHLLVGAGKVLFSQPAEANVDLTVIKGVNDHLLNASHCIVSNASCTTNCIVPVIKTIHEAFGVEYVQSTTIHSLMNDQPVIDAYHHTNLRKTRSASQSVIPVETELAIGIERILPELAGRFSATAIRVPTTNVSAMDITILTTRATSVEQINAVLQQASQGELAGVLGYTNEPLASCDFNHDRHSGIIDAGQTSISGDRLLKVFTWFDNEWGFANRMLDISQCMLAD